MNENETVQRRIRAAVRNRDEAERRWKQATLELESYCREARSLGITVTEIARLAGVSRQAVYDFLNRSARASG